MKFVARFDHVVVGNEVALAWRDDSIQVLLRIRRVDLALGQLRGGGIDLRAGVSGEGCGVGAGGRPHAFYGVLEPVVGVGLSDTSEWAEI